MYLTLSAGATFPPDILSAVSEEANFWLKVAGGCPLNAVAEANSVTKSTFLNILL